MHDTAAKNNPFQCFSLFQESILLYSLNTWSYESHHNSLTVKDIFNLSCSARDTDLTDQQGCVVLTKESTMQAPV